MPVDTGRSGRDNVPMLLPEQVIPFLGHQDALLRDQAYYYFSEAHDVAPLTADAIWQAIDCLDPQESAALLVALLARVPQSDASTDRLLAAFNDERLCDVEDDLWDAVHDIEFEQLHRHRERILALPDLRDDFGEHLSARLELAESPFETLWDRLLAHIDKTRGQYWNRINRSISARLIEALARHGDAAAARAMHCLQTQVVSDDPDATDIYAVQLLGRLRHRPALDLLLKAFRECDEEDDVLHEELMFAIPPVGGADAVAPVESEFPAASQAYQIYAAGLLGRIKHPSAEAAIARLIDDPALADVNIELGLALADLCPTDALPALQRLVLAGDYDGQFAELRDNLVACALMAGVDFPELGALREEVIARTIQRQRRLDAMASRMIDGRGFDDDYFDDDDDRGFDDPDLPPLPADLDDRYPPVVAPIHRDGPKVGRNDPCPCGSGKKYKKCCLDKSA
jgi:hypothetical protein